MRNRILVAAVWVPVLVYVVLCAPPAVMTAALCVLAGAGNMELQQCVGGERRSALVVMSAAVGVLTVAWYHARVERMALLFLLETLVLFGYAIAKGGAVRFHQICAALFGGFSIGWSFASFLRLEATGIQRAYLLLPFLLSFTCDTFAYFVGCSIGKHKLAPKISPKKTVEGSIGGLAGNVLCGLIFAWAMDRWFAASIGYGPMVVLALVCGVVAQIGDLSFSWIKREFGVKDYGRLFLDHGGVLDRFDSVLFVAPMMELVFTFLGKA